MQGPTITDPSSERLLLTDAAIRRLPFAPTKPRIVRDSKIPGFHLWVGKQTKSFRFQYVLPRSNGRRGRTQIEALGEHPHRTAEQARALALELQARRARGEAVRVPSALPGSAKSEPTLTAVWEAYKAALVRQGRSPRTIADYEDKVRRHLARFHDRPLSSITREEVIASAWARWTLASSSSWAPLARARRAARLEDESASGGVDNERS